MPEVRRVLLADWEPAGDHSFQQWWSTFRRQHQARAQRCHRARRASALLPEPERPATITPLVSTVPELDDARWEQVAELVPGIRRRGEEPPLEQRTILEGILWVARTGRSWKDLPAPFGPWETIHAYYHRWKQKAAWPAILAALRAPLEPAPP